MRGWPRGIQVSETRTPCWRAGKTQSNTWMQARAHTHWRTALHGHQLTKKMDQPGYTIRERGTCQPCVSMWQTRTINYKIPHSNCPCSCPSLPSGIDQITIPKVHTCPTDPTFLYTFNNHELKPFCSTRMKNWYNTTTQIHPLRPTATNRNLSKNSIPPEISNMLKEMLLLICGSPFKLRIPLGKRKHIRSIDYSICICICLCVCICICMCMYMYMCMCMHACMYVCKYLIYNIYI